jgi:pimeloyl-ACP methyl ester carboxylesterase
VSEILNPDGSPVSFGNIDVSAVGLGGTVEVLYPGGKQMRSVEEATEALLGGLKDANIIEQFTVAISEPQEHPGYLGENMRRNGNAPPSPQLTVSLPDPGPEFGQIILACDEDGVLHWHAANEAAPLEGMRGGARRIYTIPARVPKETTEGKRGLIGAVGKKLLKVLVFEVMDRVFGGIGNHFVSKYELRHMPHRLRLFAAGNYRTEEVGNLQAQDVERLAEGRALLFIHGTASRTHKAFAQLPLSFVEKLVARYDGRVFAFDHPTLSVTPAANVRWFVEAISSLPQGRALDVDIIAHSRGGLVARMMCEQIQAHDLNLDRLSVRNLAMVATPNAGTPLADRGHIDAFLDTMTNLFEFLPDNPATNTLDILFALVKQVALGALGGLDGLAAMDPQGEFLCSVLNQASQVHADYHAIGADFEPAPNSPLARYVRDYLTDLIFLGQPNDLVVPTEGVFSHNGATRFPIHDHLSLAKNEAVDHSGYWTNAAALSALDRWL